MTIQELVSVKVPECTETYTPVSHKELLGGVKKELIINDMDFKFRFKSSKDGKMMTADFIIKNDQADITKMITVINSYNKQLKVGIAQGSFTAACFNGMIFGETSYMKKHTGDVNTELQEMIKKQVGEIDKYFYHTLTWLEDLKLQPVTPKEMISLIGQMTEERVLNPRELKRLEKQVNNPSFDYGGYNNTLYEFYQHGTHAIKTVRPALVTKTNKKLNTFIHDIRKN